ncbi:MAG: GNAT family N-acetyltransferase [Ramlibacter sp.]
MKQVEVEPVTIELLREREDKQPVGMIRQRLGAIDDVGLMVGFSEAERGPWEPPGLWHIRVIVDMAYRNRDIGARLYEAALQYVREQDATTIKTFVRDNQPADLAFAQRRGFCVDRHTFESILDLAAFDEQRFVGIVEAVRARGVTFFSFADITETTEDRRKTYDLNAVLIRDSPGADDPFPPFEDFERYYFGGSHYRPDALIHAAVDHRLIGVAAHGYLQPTNSMVNLMTGVIREYRGHKVALALKLLGIACGRRAGAVYMRTNNDSENRPMLAINEKLGYKPEPGLYNLVLKLD